jgi:phosphate transport system permease protein
VSTPTIAVPPTAEERRQITGRRIDGAGTTFQILLLVALIVSLGFLAILLVSIFTDGWAVYSERGTDFLTSGLSRSADRAGVWQGIFGSLVIGAFVVVVAFPLGIATAVYLEEYAPESRLTRFIDVNIRNLAGVPSVVYGLLGLAVFVKYLGDDLTSGGGITGGRSLISAGLTLAILVLPLVIITTAEALRAVPRALREGGYGVGATRWDVVRTLVLPNAAPGILTGTVLALSRALGETAPLILIGAIGGRGFLAEGDAGFVEQLRGSFTALPMIVFGWAKDPSEDFRSSLTPSAIMALLVITLIANSVAIVLRNRYERRW